MIVIWMMSAKSTTYDVQIPVHDVTRRVLSRDSNYIVEVVMWPKFDNSSIFMRSYNVSFIGIWSEKSIFLRDASMGLALAMALKFYTSVQKC